MEGKVNPATAILEAAASVVTGAEKGVSNAATETAIVGEGHLRKLARLARFMYGRPPCMHF